MLEKCLLDNKCLVDFVIIIPAGNIDIFELTDEHFKGAHLISNLDGRWNPQDENPVSVQIVSVDGAVTVLTDLAKDVKFKMSPINLNTRSSSSADVPLDFGTLQLDGSTSSSNTKRRKNN